MLSAIDFSAIQIHYHYHYHYHYHQFYFSNQFPKVSYFFVWNKSLLNKFYFSVWSNMFSLYENWIHPCPLLGVSNGPIQFRSAGLSSNCSQKLVECTQKFCYCSHARILVKIPVWQNWADWVKMHALWMPLETCIPVLLTFYWSWRT